MALCRWGPKKLFFLALYFFLSPSPLSVERDLPFIGRKRKGDSRDIRWGARDEALYDRGVDRLREPSRTDNPETGNGKTPGGLRTMRENSVEMAENSTGGGGSDLPASGGRGSNGEGGI
jgi:hypothetical protein